MITEKTLTLTQEFRILKAIEKIFSDNHNSTTPEDDVYSCVCPSNVSLIVAKSDFGKKLLLRFLYFPEEKSKKGKPLPTLEYFAAEKDVPKVKISMEYLTNILDIFKYDDSVSITIKKDYPITIENKDFKCIIAPRVESED